MPRGIKNLFDFLTLTQLVFGNDDFNDSTNLINLSTKIGSVSSKLFLNSELSMGKNRTFLPTLMVVSIDAMVSLLEEISVRSSVSVKGVLILE